VPDVATRRLTEPFLPCRLPPFQPVDASFSGHTYPRGVAFFLAPPGLFPSNVAATRYAANFDAIVSVALRTVSDTITRVTPLMIMLTPTSVPIAQIELDGHCA
jgi:hypothetical protein